jgi:LPXTG-motif cell wall-anchored protein
MLVTYKSLIANDLATTGSDPNAIIWAVLGGLVVLAAVFLRPKRRKAQADSTNVPSDLKE